MALFIDEAHDLNGHTLTAQKRSGVFSMMNALEQVQETLSQLTELCTESLLCDFDDAG